MKYRDHRGSLTESLKTQQEITSINELKTHLNKFYAPFGRKVEEIQFDYIGHDSRTGWDTYRVLQRFEGEKEFTVAGMSDGKLS